MYKKRYIKPQFELINLFDVDIITDSKIWPEPKPDDTGGDVPFEDDEPLFDSMSPKAQKVAQETGWLDNELEDPTNGFNNANKENTSLLDKTSLDNGNAMDFPETVENANQGILDHIKEAIDGTTQSIPTTDIPTGTIENPDNISEIPSTTVNPDTLTGLENNIESVEPIE